MTNLEALKGNISESNGIVFTSNTYEKALFDVGLKPYADYNQVYEKPIDMATIRLYRISLGSANMQEGNLSYSLTNKEYIQNTIDSLLVKWGLAKEFSAKQPTVNGSGSLW